MAQGISLISGSPLIGNPIVYQVTPEAYNQDYTFHRIIVRVYAKLKTDDDYTTFDFSTPVETKPNGLSYSTQPSRFDISSALQAVADKYEYTPEPPERYPYIKFRIEAWDEWMEDGNTDPQQNPVGWPSLPAGNTQFYGYAFMGAFNDIERMNALIDGQGVEYLNLTYLSRKPNTSPEVVFKNTPFIYPVSFSPARSIGDTDHITSGANPDFVSGAPSNGPKSESSTQETVGAATVGGHSIYVIDKPARSYELRFVNGMGVMESVHVTSLPKKESNIHTEKYTIARQETLKKFSRAITVKSEDYETWTLSSGPLDEAWVSWYVHEFLMSKSMWIKVGDTWIPCHVLPEETTTMRDTEKASMMSVQFRLQMDINGPLLSE